MVSFDIFLRYPKIDNWTSVLFELTDGTMMVNFWRVIPEHGLKEGIN